MAYTVCTSICRAGVWEDNDPSLSVNCYNDPGQAAREQRVTTTTTVPPPPPPPPPTPVAAEEEIIDEVFDGESTTFPSLKKSTYFTLKEEQN